MNSEKSLQAYIKECRAFSCGSEDRPQKKSSCLAGGNRGLGLRWLRSWSCLHRPQSSSGTKVQSWTQYFFDWFCRTEIFFFLCTLQKRVFPCSEDFMRWFECWSWCIGDVPLYLFFCPLYIPFSSLLLSLVSAEQLRISVAWRIPGNLSLLELLAEF